MAFMLQRGDQGPDVRLDSSSADDLVQIGLFGEIVYG